MTAIAIIPARGGSKRIPHKNIVPFMGRPMLAWTVDAALSSGQFDKVLVSTNDEEIAQVARVAGAEVPFLRIRHADDHASVSEAVLAALEQSEKHWHKAFEVVCQLMPNCPLRGSDDIRQAMKFFNDNEAKFQISMFRFGWMNPWWAAERNADATARSIFPHALKQRSQDLPPLYCPTGAIWLARSSEFKREKTFYGAGYLVGEIDWQAAIDIDDQDDFAMAEAVYLMRELSKGHGRG